MLTPEFELQQNDECLIILIKVPYAKISETDIYFEDFDFKFYCKPYFLKLKLPGRVVFCEQPNIKYDVDSYQLTIYLPKLVKGQEFENLECLTAMLAPKRQPLSGVPKIEVVGETRDDSEDFEYDTLPIDEEADSVVLKEMPCGFGNLYSAAVFKLKEETSVIFDVVDPHNKSAEQRLQERLKREVADFSDDHYLADLYENEEIMKLIHYAGDWDILFFRTSNSVEREKEIHFTDEEKYKLRNLPNKEYLLDQNQHRTVLLGLLDILLAYAYNKRTVEGENTVESAWTINKLSATLSWLEVFHSADEVVRSFVQRSLTYPLFRNWDLAVKVIYDVKKILHLGRKYILKCFLEIHSLFCESDPRYILNDLFITDYCVWIQGKSCKSSYFIQLADDIIDQVKLDKSKLDLDLVNLEYAAKLVVEETAQEMDNVISSISTMNMQ